ncbi:DUF397 domain-containing protein [Streptomyces sp. NPDC056716]|uniref:DUF397 domain-containing protein n=1 Tax=unclassified Streptomyces TaxID=2593676 RepID=UPI00368F0473
MTATTQRAFVRASDLTDAWFKSTYSAGEQACVEVADLRHSPLAAVAICDSKDPDGPALLFEPGGFAAFTKFAAGFEV